MTALLASINSWWNDRVTSAVEERQREEIANLTAELVTANELLEMERVKNRVQQVEITELAAVVGRNFQRVQAETKSLGGMGVKADLPGDSA